MSHRRSQRDMQTKPLASEPTSSLANLHIIPYIRWQRESHEAFERHRAKLLNILTRLQVQMSGDGDRAPLQYLLLGGQTVILDDIAAVRPDLVTMFVIYNAGGRLGIGPWYVTVDEALVSGESLVRNLLAAQEDATQHGLKLTPVAYVPDSGGHIAQLPQILREFDIDAAFLRHGAPVTHLPFRWEGPDGTSVLVVNPDAPMTWPLIPDSVDGVVSDVQSQRVVRPDGPFMWLFDCEQSPQSLLTMASRVEEKTGLPIKQNDLFHYVRYLRQELPDSLRPSLKGELRLQSLREHTYLLPGTLSSRIYLKQANARLQAYLAYGVEPWMTLALSHGNVIYPENLQALLDRSWRLLIQNQSRNALGGTGSDTVHRENELRYRQVEDISAHIINESLEALPGTPHREGVHIQTEDVDETYVVVWNAHNWPVKQVVEVKLDLPPGKFPARLLSAEGEEQLFGWTPSEVGGSLSFLGDVPAVGYASYVIELGDTPPSDRHLTYTSPGDAIGKSNGETLRVEDGVLVWRRDDRVIGDLLRFYDGGDAGDVFNYAPPDPDVVVRADLTNDVLVESSPLYDRLIIKHRMRVAPALGPDRGRGRGVKLIELETTATFYEGVPGVHFRTTFENTAQDHRLRAHLRTNIQSDDVLADSAFAVVKRRAVLDGPSVPPDGAQNLEGIANTQPMHNFVAVTDGEKSLAVLVRGLPEYEALPEDDQLTLALTLVRAVGWLSRDDLSTRTASVGPMIPVPEAQCQRELVAEFALIKTPPGDHAALVRAGIEFNAPLQAYQYDAQPERGRRSYLSIISDRGIGSNSDGEGAILTALKPPENGRGWVIRLFNPHDQPVEVYVTSHERPDRVYRVTMSEQTGTLLESDANGRVTVRIDAHQIVTLRIIF